MYCAPPESVRRVRMSRRPPLYPLLIEFVAKTIQNNIFLLIWNNLDTWPWTFCLENKIWSAFLTLKLNQILYTAGSTDPRDKNNIIPDLRKKSPMHSKLLARICVLVVLIYVQLFCFRVTNSKSFFVLSTLALLYFPH